MENDYIFVDEAGKIPKRYGYSYRWNIKRIKCWFTGHKYSLGVDFDGERQLHYGLCYKCHKYIKFK